ncbi:alpha/beta hydrolase [Candidatus Saccharibacteria bacterium]|nr:alpha/beta hydrolase [Candidatus Saccharibacteria bacterium]
MRQSEIITQTDGAGEYEVEVFDCENPKSVILCVHGNGVRRWDGERFFYAVADHYSDRIVILVDQNQTYMDGCQLNPLEIMVSRVQGIVDMATKDYPNIPKIVMGHSMGCGIATQLDTTSVDRMVFVAPVAGDFMGKQINRYGPEVEQGMVVKTSDGLTKFLTKEYVASFKGIVWEDEYRKFLQKYHEVYVFESGDEEIVGEERLTHRDMPFAEYTIIPGAKHNLAGEPLHALFGHTDTLV